MRPPEALLPWNPTSESPHFSRLSTKTPWSLVVALESPQSLRSLFRRLKNYQHNSTERQKGSQNLAPVLVIISGNSLVFSRKIITSTGFYRCCASRRVSTSSGKKSVSHFSPLQHSKTPRTPNLSKICSWGFQSGRLELVKKLSKFIRKLVFQISTIFDKFQSPWLELPKTIAGTNLGFGAFLNAVRGGKSGGLRVRLEEWLGKPMGLDSEPFLKPIGRANSTQGQP